MSDNDKKDNHRTKCEFCIQVTKKKKNLTFNTTKATLCKVNGKSILDSSFLCSDIFCNCSIQTGHSSIAQIRNQLLKRTSADSCQIVIPITTQVFPSSVP